MSEIAVRLSALRKMGHALGLDFSEVKRNKHIAYRNYYAAPRCDDNDWQYLLSIGYAELGELAEDCMYYHVTRSGMDFIEKVTGIKITESD